jgi:DNA polymerase-3 subunit delta
VAQKSPARPAPVHVILGEDTYLAEEALEAILSAAIGSERNDALTVLQGDEVSWAQIVGALRSGSLFASRRAVVVRRADMLRGPKEEEDGEEGPAAKGRAKAEDDAARYPVLGYLGDPSPDATLVLLATKPDRRRKPWKRLCADGEVHSADRKKGAALRAHVEAELRKRGLRLDPQAVQELIDEVGQDLRRLMGEVDKLEAWRGDGGDPLSIEDVHSVLGRGMGRPLYLLADAAAARDLRGSVERLQELLEGREEPLRILATLHRSLRQVRAARAMRERRVPKPEIAQRLLPPHMQFKLEGLLAAAGRWTDAELRLALAAFDRADRRVKRGSDAATALVAALAEACRGGPGATSRRGR